MSMTWYNPNLERLEITILKYGLNLSKGVFDCLNSRYALIGIDKENKFIGLKPSDNEEDSFKICGKEKFFRIYCKRLITKLEENKVELKKYRCEWNEKEKLLTIKY